MSQKISLPRGTADILPQESFLWQNIEKKARSVLETYHYKEIRTPIFEEIGLFSRSLGESSEVVNKQLLRLASDKKDGFALRPEGTASVVRSYIENRLDKQEPLTKLFYFGPMFRGERPQKGRLRQFHQVGVEAIGENTSSPYLDAEVIALSLDLLKNLGLNDFTLKINTLGTTEDKKAFAEILKSKLQEHKKHLSDESQERLDRNVFRVLDSKNPKDQDIVKKLKIGHSYLSKESLAYYQELKGVLDGLGVAYQESDHLVRGLDYYTHTVFEISVANLGAQDAVGAGGRYNTLVSDLGGPQVDAVGFALGIERILLAREKQDDDQGKGLKVFLVALDEGCLQGVFNLLQKLRQRGVTSDMSYKSSSLKSQMRQANKLAAQHVIILGQDELAKGIVTVKNMDSGHQIESSINDIEQIIHLLE